MNFLQGILIIFTPTLFPNFSQNHPHLLTPHNFLSLFCYLCSIFQLCSKLQSVLSMYYYWVWGHPLDEGPHP